jgi:hypothetical protein
LFLQMPTPDIPIEAIIRQESQDRRRRHRRPKSESLSLRVSEAYALEQCQSAGTAAVNRRAKKTARERPCSDLGEFNWGLTFLNSVFI